MSYLASSTLPGIPLVAELPKSASDYYAIVDADLKRIESDIYCIPSGMVTVDYSLPYQYRFSVADSSGEYLDCLQQKFDKIETSKSFEKLAGNVAFLEDRFTAFNICHFLFDKLASACGFKYDAFIANDLEFPKPNYSDWEHTPSLNRRDIEIDIDKFRMFLGGEYISDNMSGASTLKFNRSVRNI